VVTLQDACVLRFAANGPSSLAGSLERSGYLDLSGCVDTRDVGCDIGPEEAVVVWETSVQHRLVPPVENHVRAEIMLDAWVLLPRHTYVPPPSASSSSPSSPSAVPPASTLVVHLSQMDWRGTLPPWLVATAVDAQTLVPADRLRSAVARLLPDIRAREMSVAAAFRASQTVATGGVGVEPEQTDVAGALVSHWGARLLMLGSSEEYYPRHTLEEDEDEDEEEDDDEQDEQWGAQSDELRRAFGDAKVDRDSGAETATSVGTTSTDESGSGGRGARERGEADV
jgi:hypothetical protein